MSLRGPVQTGLSILSALALTAPAGQAATVVLANHTATATTVEVLSAAGGAETRRIAPGESTPFFSASPLSVALGSGLNRRVESLAADAVYRLATVRVGDHSGVELRRIALMGEAMAPPNAAAWQNGAGRADAPVRVLLCVDEEEPTIDRLWQARLTARLKAASAIMQRHSGVRFEPAGFQFWKSDNSVTQFTQSLGEFEHAVSPPPGTLAIGFTSQYQVQLGRQHMGGTRGPLRGHILLREWSPRVSEAERVELLVHELGHYLGAGHSPEPTSVMRPVLGDRPVRLRGEVIRFDPVNTLAIAMIGEEVRRRGVRDLGNITLARRERLQHVYTTLSALTPGEPAGVALLRRLAAVGGGPIAAAGIDEDQGGAVSDEDRSEAAASAVVAAITQAAASSRKRDLGDRLTGDALADALVRAGAGATSDPRGLLLGLGVALDDVGGLKINPRTTAAAERIESDRDRRQRLNVLGRPTARGRHDLLKHFVVSAALAALVGEKEANLWGVGKELADATREGGSGFSFADLAADRAGVRFARAVLSGSPPVAGIATSFRLDNYLPPIEGLEEGLPLADVIKRFGGKGDPRFDAQIAEIDRRIDALPAYSLLRLGLP
ncbi:Matrixin [Botrimarina colliarenosi]|uniref:Matrixin n=1 Tax=Botrimarina colliarenosi TaxID=2528001 RepID=A0A5C6AF08_9BACT|nr:matrixin family metalloprotease [Botrimarina colliarenosi]TWT97997.1 Matrixin [Botrimarina colliarenosi]